VKAEILNLPGIVVDETLYVEPGGRKCRILAIPGRVQPGQSPEAVVAKNAYREVGLLMDGRIEKLEKQYWPTADETKLTEGMLLEVRQPTMAQSYDA
jgi:hypothetical protein